ncbi:hypothetical protein OROMI_019281 [Orobanche minor]
MSAGLTYGPLRYSLGLPARGRGTHKKQVTFFHNFGISVDLLHLQRNGLTSSSWRRERTVPCLKCAMDSTFGDATNDSTAVRAARLGLPEAPCVSMRLAPQTAMSIFPRINVRDPYKRLGISKEASEDEIQSARNFLVKTYGGHKPSVDAIESAHNKIIMQKFYERKNPKVDINKKVREVTQSKYVQAVTSRFRTPSTKVIIRTSIAFIMLGALTVLFPTEEGPTFQVAVSLIVAMYFIHDRLKSKLRAFLYGGWKFYTFMARWDISDGFRYAACTERAEKLGSDNFIDKLHYPLGFFYISPINDHFFSQVLYVPPVAVFAVTGLSMRIY